MNGPAAVDGLVGMFLVGLQAGIPLLSDQLRGLLRSLVGIQLVVAAFAWLASYLHLFGAVMTSILKVAVFATLLTSFQYLSGAFIDYCIYGGLTLAGQGGSDDVLSVEQFKQPSTVLLRAFDATRPILIFMKQQAGWGMLWNAGTNLICIFAMLVIWLTFLALAIHLIWVLLVTYIAAGIATLFVPFGVLGATSFLATRGLSMVVEGAARLGLAALITALIFPFVDSFFLTNTPQQNLDMAAAFWLLAGAFLALLLSVGVPGAITKTVSGVPLTAMGMFFPGAGVISAAVRGVRSGGGGNGGGGGGSRSTGGAPPPREPRVERNQSIGYEFY
jgi:type IV secretory pathway TrbL component